MRSGKLLFTMTLLRSSSFRHMKSHLASLRLLENNIGLVLSLKIQSSYKKKTGKSAVTFVACRW